MTAERVEVLIVTALQLERRAVVRHLHGVHTETVTGLAADVGWYSGGGADRRVAVIETGAGSVNAAVLTARAEAALRPSVVAMVGIAGGVKDVSIGDVVASSKVYWIEGGRQGPVLQPRPDMAPVSSELVQVARAVAAAGRWPARRLGAAGGSPHTGHDPVALVAPIVVGEKVVVDRGSDVVRLIRDSYSDAVAIAMEDFGALRAGRSAERARVIAIRGISDLIDGKAAADAAGSQPVAAANAAAFLFELLAQLPRVGQPQPPARRRAIAVGAVALAIVLGIACGQRVLTLWQNPDRATDSGKSPASPTPPPPTTPRAQAVTMSPAAGAARVRWQGTLVFDGENFQTGYALDPNPPQRAPRGDLGLICHLVCEPGELGGTAFVAWDGASPPEQRQCVDLLNTRLGQTRLEVEVGTVACFGTAEKRVGVLKVASMPGSARMTLEVTVWQHAS